MANVSNFVKPDSRNLPEMNMLMILEHFQTSDKYNIAEIRGVKTDGEPRAVLYAYFLSSCSWRVRAALQLKKIPFEERSVDIVKGKHQLTEQYKSINPTQKVPALLIDGVTLVESMAIIQYLEETRPKPSLVPTSPLLRARMREICEIVVSGIQPLQNIGLKSQFETELQFKNFTAYNTVRGLESLEALLEKYTGKYCIGDQISMADLCIVPQIYNAVTRLNLGIGNYPTLVQLYAKLLDEPIFKETHPLKAKPVKLI